MYLQGQLRLDFLTICLTHNLLYHTATASYPSPSRFPAPPSPTREGQPRFQLRLQTSARGAWQWHLRAVRSPPASSALPPAQLHPGGPGGRTLRLLGTRGRGPGTTEAAPSQTRHVCRSRCGSAPPARRMLRRDRPEENSSHVQPSEGPASG